MTTLHEIIEWRGKQTISDRPIFTSKKLINLGKRENLGLIGGRAIL